MRQARRFRREMQKREDGKASNKQSARALEAVRPVSAQPSGGSGSSAHEGSRSLMGGSGAFVRNCSGRLGSPEGHLVCL